MAKPQDRTNINQIPLRFIDDDSLAGSESPLLTRKAAMIAIFNENNQAIETKIYETTTDVPIASANRRKALLYRLKIFVPFLFLFLLCCVPVSLESVVLS
jgi:hypothetical protein